ncbi:MAG: FGGY-family carbohydrate kinase [Ilumatobacteraceae bacterium]
MSGGTGSLVVGIDCGSQSAKVAVLAADGTLVAHGQRVLRPMSRPTHGVVVHPDDDLWDATIEATRAAMEMLSSIGRHSSEVAAVGLCSIRCCKVFTDADGELVEPVISWMDDRAYRPYVPLLPDGRPDPRSVWATTTSGYLMRRLTGEADDTAANCIEMQWPIDADGVDWSADDTVIGRYGLTREVLGRLVQPGEVGGRVTADAASLTGLPVGVPVVHTANDKAVEALGSGAVSDRSVVLSLGTYICAMTHGSPPSTTPGAPAAYWTNPACLPGRWLFESAGVRRGMWTVTWLLDLIGPEFADRAVVEGVSREQLLEREAASTPPGSDGLLTVLDWLAPTDHPYRKGSMLGFDARHTRGHLFRSVLEAIALTMRGHVVAMLDELGRPLGPDVELIVTGGGASGDLFMQIIADVFGVPARRLRLHSGSSPASVGAAACAAAAVGLHPSIDDAALAMAPSHERVEPRPEPQALYGRIAGELEPHLRDATDPLYRRSYPLFHEPDREDLP